MIIDSTFEPFLFPRNDETCASCGNELELPTVLWHFANKASSSIFLHPRCSLNLGIHLIKDAAFIQQSTLEAGDYFFPGHPTKEFGDTEDDN